MLHLASTILLRGLPLGLLLAAEAAQGQCGTVISSFPYSEGFETAPAWTTGGVGNDWAWGTPAHPLINSAGGGTKSWCVGGLTGANYNSNERSWLESPCFDFSGVSNPRISFKLFWEVERQYDGLTFQYSTDGGTTYSNVGAFGETPDCTSENWFNAVDIANLPASISPKHGWSGRVGITQGACMGGSGSQAWVIAKHCLAWLAFEPSVRFRFFFGAGSTCNSYDGVAVDDILIESAGSVVAAFAGDCNGNTVDFINSSSPCPNSFSWDFGEPGSPQNTSTLEDPSHVYATPGTYAVTLSVSDACGASAAITQLISVLGVEISATQPTCGQNNGSLAAVVAGANGPVNYYWSPGGATTPTLANAGPGDHSVTISAANSCPATATATLFPSTGNLVVNVSHTNVICHGGVDGTAAAVISGGVAPVSIAWSPGGSPAPVITGLGPGWINCTVTDTDGCTAMDSALVEEPWPVTVQAVPDTAICAGASITVGATATGGTGGHTFDWTPAGPVIVPQATAYYSVTATDAQGCTSAADSMQVSVASAVVPDITWSDTAGCTPLCITFGAQPATALAFAWDFGDGTTAATALVDHCFTSGGSFTVSLAVTDSAGCPGSITLPGLVQAISSPVVVLSAWPAVTTTEDPVVRFLNGSSNATGFEWHFGDALNSTSNEPSPSFAYDSVACYTVGLEATNAAGCQSTGQTEVCVEDPFMLFMPNAFTPDGDGINDVLRPVTSVRDPAGFQLHIHDRWGTVRYSTGDPQGGWDGRSAPDGLYIWSIWITDALGKPHEQRGHVVLLR
ncbi:MAG: PKD domain-containing protein [Flavobacteriales bacterium]|nr:PKD domain-containing protein [Flavobacteriales bacterium]